MTAERTGPATKESAFTLIELLIVVAIIAILAAIAVPNFLEAQVRSKVSRVNNDLRSLATAMEAYQIDNNAYVPHIDDIWEFHFFTTPIAYLSSVPRCPFAAQLPDAGLYGRGYHIETDLLMLASGGWSEPGRTWAEAYYRQGRRYLMWSIGPDLVHDYYYGGGEYDATNGTRSAGDIIRVGP
ncbi:MAG TPA: prepilin-type N-terminal cleavage/methylation domain-containing protein [Sumerlaeia bacterium]|nr:prepilin-type N-terminal cleavage/methylation domain-containing protein [Sumerlaeia bacterium]